MVAHFSCIIIITTYFKYKLISTNILQAENLFILEALLHESTLTPEGTDRNMPISSQLQDVPFKYEVQVHLLLYPQLNTLQH